MAADALDLFHLSTQRVETYSLVAVRVTTMLSFVPIFSASQLPLQARVAFGLLLAIVIAPTVPLVANLDGIYGLTTAVFSQVVIGFVFGFVASLVFAGVQFAGEILDIEIGFAVVNVINPTTQQSVTIVGEFQLALATVLFLVTNGHHFVVQGMAGSFSLVPLPNAEVTGPVAASVIDFFGRSLSIVFQIGAPTAVALFIVNVSLGLMAKVAPQMNVFVVGLPLQIGIGLIMLIVTMPIFGAVLPQYFGQLPQQFDAVFRNFEK
jgi:flagellar biosynthetic protein FliR